MDHLLYIVEVIGFPVVPHGPVLVFDDEVVGDHIDAKWSHVDVVRLNPDEHCPCLVEAYPTWLCSDFVHLIIDLGLIRGIAYMTNAQPPIKEDCAVGYSCCRMD